MLPGSVRVNSPHYALSLASHSVTASVEMIDLLLCTQGGPTDVKKKKRRNKKSGELAAGPSRPPCLLPYNGFACFQAAAAAAAAAWTVPAAASRTGGQRVERALVSVCSWEISPGQPSRR